MAIVKEFTVRRYNSYSFDANTLLAFEPNGDKVWIKEEAYDASTLAPKFSTQGSTGLTQKNLNSYHGMTMGTVLSKYPMAFSGLSEFDNGTSPLLGVNTLLYTDPSNRFNLEKSSQHGNIIEFTSSQGVKHHLIWYVSPSPMIPPGSASSTTIDVAGYGGQIRYTTYYTLIEGDDWTNPVASISGTLTGNVTGYISNYSMSAIQVIPIAVDPVNKFIYCHQVVAQVTNTPTGWNLGAPAPLKLYSVTQTRNISIAKFPFTTRLDSTLAIASSTGNAILNGLIYTTHSFDTNPIFYCGRNNDGTPMFMTQIENDTSFTLNQNGVVDHNVNNTYYTAKTLWNGVKTNSAPKIYFDKLAGGVQTNVASINTSSNQFSSTGASKTMGFFAPSKFEASTASGETNIFYSYSLCFNSSSEPSIIYYRWDKATPTASANLCSIDWNGVTSTDKISFAFPTALAISSYNPHKTTTHCFVTTLGSNRYLNVLQTHGDLTTLSTKTLPGQTLMTTFQIDTSTWQSLTYVGSISVSALSYCSLNDANSRIAVISNIGMFVYACTDGVWSLASSEAGAINIVARDYNDRVWALDIGNYDYTQNATVTGLSSDVSWTEASVKLILHSSVLPNLATVEFVTRDQTYTGTNLTNQLRVNAYDTSSNRIATTVTLNIVGTNAYFTSNSSTSINITTSAVTDTNVGITITGPGLLQVTASFAL